MLDPQPTLVLTPGSPIAAPRELLATWLLGRHEDLHLWKLMPGHIL